jgi:rod shape determining protein RodA
VRTSWYQRIEWDVLAMWIVLVSLGLVAIYSATHGPSSEFVRSAVRDNFERQFVWIGVCILGIVAAFIVPVRFYQYLGYPLYLITLLLVIGALIFGREINGARSWLYLGPVGVQSSELAKVGTVMAVSQFLSSRALRSRSVLRALVAIVLILVPAVLIVLQNDAGTALVYFGLIPVVLFWSGIPLLAVLLIIGPVVAGYLAVVSIAAASIFAGLFSLGLLFYTREYRVGLVSALFTGVPIVTVFAALTKLLQPHQVARIASFVDPEAYSQTSGFHVIQAKAAIGSGGFWGKGFMQGTQTQLAFVPEQSTDFIFCVIGEEFGFLGVTILLVIFALLLIRLVAVGSRTKHPFVHMIAAGTAGIYFIHLVINVGMTLGVMPIIGIPLPFISYGGSAMIANTSLLAITLALSMRRDELPLHGTSGLNV